MTKIFNRYSVGLMPCILSLVDEMYNDPKQDRRRLFTNTFMIIGRIKKQQYQTTPTITKDESIVKTAHIKNIELSIVYPRREVIFTNIFLPFQKVQEISTWGVS